MSNTLGLLTSFPPNPKGQSCFPNDLEYDHGIKNFITSLNRLSLKDFLKGAGDADFLDILDPSVNTISYLYTLNAHFENVVGNKKTTRGISETILPGKPLWNQTVRFLETFDPRQVRYIGAEWKRLVDNLQRVARDHGRLAAAVKPMRTAMLRLDPSAGTFTTTHLHFLRLCLDARTYRLALPILDKNIHSFPSMTPVDRLPLCADHHLSNCYITYQSGFTDAITTADVQEYYLLGAIIHIQLRIWDRALLYLEHVIAAPTQNTTTALMVEAYRKWVLVATLVHGRPGKTPRSANSMAIKQLKAVSKHYDVIPSIFQDGNARRLQAEIEEGKQIWEEDGNAHLIDEVFMAFHRFSVANLASIYATIPVPLVSQHLRQHPDQTETYLNLLIADGHLNAIIEQPPPATGKPPILRFINDPSAGPLAKTEEQRQAELVRQTARTNELAKHVKEADWRWRMSREYVDHHNRTNKGGGGGGGGMMDAPDAGLHGRGDIMDTSFEAPDEGEDIMMDLQ